MDLLPASYDNWRMYNNEDAYEEDDEWDRVSAALACPNPACEENRQEWLTLPEWGWGDVVHCESCGVWYHIN